METIFSKHSYYAVIFTSELNPSITGYHDMAVKMEMLAKQQDGFLGIETARTDIGITVSYWRDEASIKTWKAQLEHRLAQDLGRVQWYKWYRVRVCKVEREYGFGS
ncbi:MAG: antibiotic biosynthesis monooxygenase [Flavobacteriaceae bacterium]|nr:antibiotic biosynthesis monooxygenase [Bacteroidia bacterium]NNK88010.1 antibiotic biosynthesis monooxygenase [Flavobacteriaceae bacterium]